MLGERVDKAISAMSAKERSFLQSTRRDQKFQLPSQASRTAFFICAEELAASPTPSAAKQ
ncbi:MAG: hypothetical protein DME61_04385 [Verrucomicrobia bacterium]|nr:MAG: hypothetical protein DME61_04385 [Verrucomicrobiota bacterium]